MKKNLLIPALICLILITVIVVGLIVSTGNISKESPVTSTQLNSISATSSVSSARISETGSTATASLGSSESAPVLPRPNPRSLTVERFPNDRSRKAANSQATPRPLALPPLQPALRDGVAFPITLKAGQPNRMNILFVTLGCQFPIKIWRLRNMYAEAVQEINVACSPFYAQQFSVGNQFQYGDVLIIEYAPNLFISEKENLVELPLASYLDNRNNDPITLQGVKVQFR
jgi:hypothetical protein